MIKFSQNSDFNFNTESVVIVTDSQQLTKRASAQDLLKFAKTKGQTDLHIIAVGAYEGTGYNRNGDRFDANDCKNNHKYFKEADRAVHRHHKNKKNDPKFGNIKAAAYNEPMKRIELIVGLDNEKCADILDEQEKKGHTNWSMASRQKYDICSWCGHKAYSDSDRCEHIPANIGEINKTGEMCGMINPDPKWFEISYVSRPADRIGMSLKVASDSRIRPMLPRDYLKIYSGFEVPQDEFLISKKASDKRYLLDKLAEMEKHVEALAQSSPKTSKDAYLSRHAAKLNQSDHLSPETIDELRKMDPSKLMKALADNGIVFRPDEFAKYLFGDRIHKENIDGMKTHLPDIFQSVKDDKSGDVVNNEKYEPSPLSILPPEIKQMVSKLIDDHSISDKPALRRVIRITIMHGDHGDMPLAKSEGKTKEAFDKELAKQYASYKIAALNYINEKGNLNDDLLWNALIQNRG